MYDIILAEDQAKIKRKLQASTFKANFIGPILAQIVSAKYGEEFIYSEMDICQKEMTYQYGDRWEGNVKHRCRVIIKRELEPYLNYYPDSTKNKLKNKSYFILDKDFFGEYITIYKGLKTDLAYYDIIMSIDIPCLKDFVEMIVEERISNPLMTEEEIRKTAENYISTLKKIQKQYYKAHRI